MKAPGPIQDIRGAERFLAGVGIALRYGPSKNLPLASLYLAFGGEDPGKPALKRAIALTNQLLGEGHAIEVHVIAGRVTLVHRSLVPALHALVRRGRPVDDLRGLSADARIALALLDQRQQVTAGDVRERLGVKFDARADPAYAALSELTGSMLVDRGPFEVPKAGIPYLSTDGYPYHLFHEAHPDLAAAARRYSTAAAAEALLGAYLAGAASVPARKLATIFKAVLSPAEIEQALSRLPEKKK